MLNKSVLEKGLELAEGLEVYGVLIDDLTIVELKAVAAIGWNAYTNELNKPLKCIS